MHISFSEEVKKNFEVTPPFMPGDKVTFQDNGFPGITTVAYAHVTKIDLVDGIKFACWHVITSGYTFHCYQGLNAPAITDEHIKFLNIYDSRKNSWQVKKFIPNKK